MTVSKFTNQPTIKEVTEKVNNIIDNIPTVPSKISDLTDDTATYPIDKADTLTGLTASITELNYVDGVTSAIQTQLNGKVPTSRTINGKALSSNITLNIDDLGDVSVTSPTQGQNLSYDAVLGKWKNTTVSATMAWGGLTGDISNQTDLYNILAELSVNQSLEDYLDLIIAGQTANLPIVITNPYNQSIADIITGA